MPQVFPRAMAGWRIATRWQRRDNRDSSFACHLRSWRRRFGYRAHQRTSSTGTLQLNACSTIRAASSAARLPERQPTPTITAWRHMRIEAITAASSSGRTARRSITSAAMPSLASASAACVAFGSEPP